MVPTAGTANDVSFLIDYLPAYLFPLGERTVDRWGVAGISLGGHSAWILLGGGEIVGSCQNQGIETLLHRYKDTSRNTDNRVSRLRKVNATSSGDLRDSI